MSEAATREAAVESTAGRPPIRMSLVVPLPVAEAFDLFTAEIGSWWPMETHSVGREAAQTCRFEGGEGGVLVEIGDDGSRHVWGTVLVWEPPARVRLTWHPGREPDSAQDLEVRFVAEGGATRVELVHGGWERLGPAADLARERYAGGWQHVFAARFGEAAAARARRG